MASLLIAMASNLQPNRDGLQPISDGHNLERWPPTYSSHGLQPNRDGLQPDLIAMASTY